MTSYRESGRFKCSGYNNSEDSPRRIRELNSANKVLMELSSNNLPGSAWSSHRRENEIFDADIDGLLDRSRESEIHRRNASGTVESSQLERTTNSMGDDDNCNSTREASHSTIMKKYRDSRNENDVLLRTIRDQQREIEELKSIVKSLQSDVDSSESRHEKGYSTSSSLPVVRVTPQKRTPSLSSDSSNRRSASRRLFDDGVGEHIQVDIEARTETRSHIDQARVRYERGSASEGNRSNALNRNTQQTTPSRNTGMNTSLSRRVLRNARIDSDVPESSTATETPESTPGRPVPVMTSTPATRTEPRRSNHTRPSALSRSLSSTSSPQAQRRRIMNGVAVSEPRAQGRLRLPNETFVLESGDSSSTDRPVDATSPGYYLRLMRPNFIRRLEFRQSVIRAASERRMNIEAQRKDAVRLLATGAVRIDDVADILLTDPTQIRAFPEKDMKAITKRKIVSTSEYRSNVLEREKKIDKTSNRIMAMCFNLNTRRKLLTQ